MPLSMFGIAISGARGKWAMELVMADPLSTYHQLITPFAMFAMFAWKLFLRTNCWLLLSGCLACRGVLPITPPIILNNDHLTMIIMSPLPNYRTILLWSLWPYDYDHWTIIIMIPLLSIILMGQVVSHDWLLLSPTVIHHHPPVSITINQYWVVPPWL